MDMGLIATTERLRLRQFVLEDAPFIIELLNSPGWLQNIGDRKVHTAEEAVAYLHNGPLKSYAQNGYGPWLVETKEDNKPVGMFGILKRDFLPHPDIGFALLPPFMGKGYAFEMASTVLAHAKSRLQLSKLCAIVLAENGSSRKLLEKLQFQLDSTIIYPDTKEELLLYIH